MINYQRFGAHQTIATDVATWPAYSRLVQVAKESGMSSMQHRRMTHTGQSSRTRHSIRATTQLRIISYEATEVGNELWGIYGVREDLGLRRIPLRMVHFRGVVAFAIAVIDVV